MKKLLAVCLTFCLISSTAYAADKSAPARWMFDSDSAYQDALADWEAQNPIQEPLESADSKPIESAGAENGDSDPVRLDADPSDDKYPVGSYIDADGRVWSPSGKLLTPDPVPSPAAVEAREAPSDGLGNPADPADQAIETPLISLPETAPVWYVEDLRPSEAPVEVLDGLKALVTSVFGEYTPITTTSVITETVGSETHQYLVETVAPGAAGVDYEWLAGVFLFGILLFCLMKLLGGVIS